MERDLSPWNTHSWITSRLEFVPGRPLFQQICDKCARAFIDEVSTGQRYAVHISVFKLQRLSEEVTAQWLSEKCPGELQMADQAARQTRFIGESSRSGVAERANEDQKPAPIQSSREGTK
jgi:hypothetical protein